MSNFVVSARKYRPKTFDDVVGQGHVSDTLKKALQSEKIAHAYLFCGPRGVGKTTCARILAKVMNCDTPVDKHTPCNTCESCKSFEEYASFNIIELDAASNNSVENIRSLIEQVRIQPQNGKYKTFIIDEVHMLSQAAFNAFLKTLEEPPPNVIFIMATTEKHKILPTILSRCQIYDFKRIQASDIVPQLEFILKQENKSADKEALHIIGQKADGAMRDALSIFDRIASASGDHITYKDVVENLNILDYDYYFKILDNLVIGNLAEVLLQYDSIIHKGFDGEQFILGLSEHLRNLLMLSFPNTHSLLDVGDSLLARYKDQINSIPKNVLMTYLNLINECDVQYANARNKRLHVELVLSKMSYAPKMIDSAAFPAEKKTKVVTEASNPAPSSFSNQTVKKEEAISNDQTSKNKPVDSAQEQKTVNQTSSQPTTQTPNQNTSTNLTPKEVQAKEDKPETKVEPKKEEPKLTEAAIKTQADLLKNPSAISQIGIPSISINSFSSVEEQVRQEESNRTENKKEITIEDTQKVIKAYSDQHPSNSIKQVLSIVKIAVEEDKLVLQVPSVIAQESIAQQDSMLDLLREEFGQPDLAIPITIVPELFPNYSSPVLKVTLSDKDKYLAMVEKNPLLKELQKTLDLHPDH